VVTTLSEDLHIWVCVCVGGGGGVLLSLLHLEVRHAVCCKELLCL
jgi:hypothetical protein